MKSNEDIDPRQIQLDINNPRFSLHDFNSEGEILAYLYEKELVTRLVDSILDKGFDELGERPIVLKKNNKYTVLEGNRRVAALKLILNGNKLLKQAQRIKAEKFKVDNFTLNCDIVSNRSEANYKISAMHISGILQWQAVDKRVYYVGLFDQFKDVGETNTKALTKIAETSPESKTEIRKAIREFNFLKVIHDEVKKDHPELPVLSDLNSEVLAGRILTRLKKTVKLTFSEDLEVNLPEPKNQRELFLDILKEMGLAAWGDGFNPQEPVLFNTRSLNTQTDWDNMLAKGTIPGLKEKVDTFNDNRMKAAKEETQKKAEERAAREAEEARKEAEERAAREAEEARKKAEERVTREAEEAQKKAEERAAREAEEAKRKARQKEYSLWTSQHAVVINDSSVLGVFVKLTDIYSRFISSASSEYAKIGLKRANVDDPIYFDQNGRFGKESENGKYNIIVTYKDVDKILPIEIKFSKKKEPRKERSNDVFTSEWIENQKNRLRNKESVRKISTCLTCLEYVRNVNESNNQYVFAALLRPLIEMTSKELLIIEATRKKKDPDLGGSLDQVTRAAVQLIKQQRKADKETTKSWVFNSEFDQLNGMLHDPRVGTLLTPKAIKDVFQKFQSYLEVAFKIIEDSGK